MKTSFQLLLFAGLFVLLRFSQTCASGSTAIPSEINILDSKVPQSPALVLLGIEPASIQRPTSPKELGMSLYSAMKESPGGVPKNLAVEVAPFWLVDHPNFDFTKRYDQRTLPTIIHTLSLSIATKTNDNDTSNISSEGCLGIRFKLFEGSKVDEYNNGIKKYQLLMLDAKDTTEENKWSDSIKHAVHKIQQDKSNQLEFAAAVSGIYPKNNFTNGKIAKWGAWLSYDLRYSISESNSNTFSAIFLARYLGENTSGSTKTFIDVGFRPYFAMNNINLSFEYVYRFELETNDTSTAGNINAGTYKLVETKRCCAMIEYPINETITVSTTIGRDFNKNSSSDRTFVVQTGVSIGVGGLSKVSLPKK